MTVFKYLNMISPCYLSASVFPYHPARARLRSASDTTLLAVPNTIKLLKSAERRTFCYVAPCMWNELPRKVRERNSVSQFKKALKTLLFMLCILCVPEKTGTGESAAISKNVSAIFTILFLI